MKKFIHFFAVLAVIHSTSVSAQDTATEVKKEDGSPYRVTSTTGNDMRIINSGVASLYARIDMIRRATETIELETFIFNPDTAGRLVLKELAAAAKRGVKVRVLVDKSIAVLKLDENYAAALKESGIELRYYNPASIVQISSVQFRNHRKLMVIDGKEAIAGGRNVADEYYDLSKDFNFMDRDTTIEGDLVKPMKATFEEFWKSKLTQIPKPLTPPNEKHYNADRTDGQYERDLENFNRKANNAKKVFAQNDEDEKVLKFVMDYGKTSFEKNDKHNCPEAAFASDKEGGSFKERLDSKSYKEDYRLLRQEIGKWMETKIKDEVIVDSPYFLTNKLSEDMANNLLKSGKKITIFTNSLASTDAIHVSTVFNDSVTKFTPEKNFNAYVYKGKFSGESEVYSDEIKNATWGTHSKTMVFSDDAMMIGTFNIDNRSSFYNTELAVFCGGSKELADDIKKNIKWRMGSSHHLNTEGKPDDCSDLLGGVSTTKKILYNLLKIPSHLLQFLL